MSKFVSLEFKMEDSDGNSPSNEQVSQAVREITGNLAGRDVGDIKQNRLSISLTSTNILNRLREKYSVLPDSDVDLVLGWSKLGGLGR